MSALPAPGPTIVRRPTAEGGGDWPPGILPVLRRIYASRGVHGLEQARPRLAGLPSPDTLAGIQQATELLSDAIATGRPIQVVGDFDCDGATACAVAIRGLRMLGATHLWHAVPNRITHGYGLSPSLVDTLAQTGCATPSGLARLLVTVDHGIACHAGIAAAKARGWSVLVTDHHLPGKSLPPADVIVNPNQRDDAFPAKSLAGVGVIFYVLLGLRRHLRALGRLPDPEPDLASLLDLVAVGTVADLVPLDGHNRALVSAGLRRLRAGHGVPGLQALIDVAGRDRSRLGASDIGFAIAPRINAAGRLEDMALGIECLLCDEPGRARELAAVLDGINAERRGVQQGMVEEAEALAERCSRGLSGSLPSALCLFDADWHPGVVGLVASRLKEAMHRPVVAFAPSEPGSDQLRGSARSIPGFHIRDALAAVDAAEPGMIGKFGGHAMAAGLSLPREALPAFEAALVAHAESVIDPGLLQMELLSDGPLEACELDRRHAEALRDGGPWGQGFPEPLFDGVFEVLAWRPVGTRHLRLDLDSGAGRIAGIHFGGWNGTPPAPRIRIAYRLQPDDYRGGDAVQLVVVHREDAF
ncbi:single-stranded-DNA-specific exonuclease RecJ [Luteimonas vadosa]|uniref:Single-stranded-DNA-specific exonuclease RecJ n=1 Tax=Luteimonas vadosa TaxID=1165507 RepID=A0ABP9E061_9GAMM